MARSTLWMVGWTAMAAMGVACGGDDDESRDGSYEASCEKTCARIQECDSTTDVQTCNNRCKNDAAAIGPHLSGEFLDGLDQCVADATCPQLAVAAAFDTCTNEATARIAPSATVEQFCEEGRASTQECTGLSLGTAACLEAFKIFSTSALNRAATCYDKSCDQRWPCIQSEVGIQPPQ